MGGEYLIDKILKKLQISDVFLNKYYGLQAGNHDNNRVASRFSPELVDGINMIVLLMPGIAVTYMVRHNHSCTSLKQKI